MWGTALKRGEEKILGVLPLFHAFGMTAAMNLNLAIGGELILLPHFVGAPHPESLGGGVPPELAAQFVAVSLGANALFWAVLGGGTGYLHDRLSPDRRSTAGDA